MYAKQLANLFGKQLTRNGTAMAVSRRGGTAVMVATNMYIYQQMFHNSHILRASTGGDNGGSSGGSNGGSGGSHGPSGSSHATSENKKEGEIKVNEYIDQTALKAGTRWEDVRRELVAAYVHDFPAVCIPPCFVRDAKVFLKNSKIKIATVVGFPFGNTTTEVKVYETCQAIANGADEIDMVINIGWLKEGDYDNVTEEIRLIKEACGSRVILKVIVETGLLTEDEIRKVTKVVDEAGADFIKTSTGFGPRGASFRDVELF
jgi:deoxyribose-phosphate aldolase